MWRSSNFTSAGARAIGGVVFQQNCFQQLRHYDVAASDGIRRRRNSNHFTLPKMVDMHQYLSTIGRRTPFIIKVSASWYDTKTVTMLIKMAL